MLERLHNSTPYFRYFDASVVVANSAHPGADKQRKGAARSYRPTREKSTTLQRTFQDFDLRLRFERHSSQTV
jgi:isocitrate dehydrogenase kinase/phosphatase